MYDFIRVTTAVPELSVANVYLNLQNIISMAKRAQSDNPDIMLFPELCTTGYTCRDLFFQDELIKSSQAIMQGIIEESKQFSFALVIGAPLEMFGSIYNCAVVIYKGKVYGIVPKTYIPDHNEFCEKRWFASSQDLPCDQILSSVFGIDVDNLYAIPVGRGLVFSLGGCASFGVEICEDLLAPLSPSTFLALGGAQLILNSSASNETAFKRKLRTDCVRMQSQKLYCGYVYVSSGCDESTSNLVYSGHTIVAENGTVINENNNTIDTDYIMTTDIDLGKCKSDRKKITTFRDAATMYSCSETIRERYIPKTKLGSDGSMAVISQNPFLSQTASQRAEMYQNTFDIQVAGLKKRLKITGLKPVVGVSGGVDSALALLVSVRAAKELGLDAKDVTGITMPSFDTSDRTYQNAVQLMKKLGVTCKEINIKDACMKHFEDIGHDADVHDLTYEDAQARERMQVLMDYAGKNNGLIVGTADLSELALGWCTYNGDHMSMYSVNASVPKTLVAKMVEFLGSTKMFGKCAKVIDDIVNMPISSELVPKGKDGENIQQTDDIVGPYELYDFFIYYVLRYGFSPKKICFLACRAFDGVHDSQTITKCLKSFYKRFFSQQFKRSCQPDGVKIGSVSLTQSGGWQMPSDASAAVWFAQLDEI